MSRLLEADAVTVTFGGLAANDRVSLDVDEGTFVGLIGPNGAGKTTFIDALTGYLRTTAGTIHFAGEEVDGLTPHQRARRGLVRTFQSLELFEDLTVRQNLRVAAERPRPLFPEAARPNRSAREEIVDWALQLLDLDAVADRMPPELPHGQQKLVGVARALATEPKLLLLDEPAAGLDNKESSVLAGRLRGLLDHGITLLLVDHDMGLVMAVCDLIYVLDFGKIISQGTPAEVRRDPKVVQAYLGREASRFDEQAIPAATDSDPEPAP